MVSDYFYKIISLLCENSRLSKTELAKSLDIGITTAVNYLERLKDIGFLKASYSNAKSSGHRSLCYFLNPSKYIAVFSISEHSFELHLVTLSCRVKGEFMYSFNDKLDFERNIYYITEGLQLYSEKLNNENCLGICVALGEDVTERYGKSRIEKLLDIIPSHNIYIMADPNKLMAEDISNGLSVKEKALVLLLSAEKYLSAYLGRNTLYDDIVFWDFGKSCKVKNCTLEECMLNISHPTDAAEIFARYIEDITELLPLSSVYVCGDTFMDISILTELIEIRFNKEKISFKSINKEQSTILLANKARKAYIDNIISSYLNK